MARVVDATGYVTVAEREIDPASTPNSTPAVLWPVACRGSGVPAWATDRASAQLVNDGVAVLVDDSEPTG